MLVYACTTLVGLTTTFAKIVLHSVAFGVVVFLGPDSVLHLEDPQFILTQNKHIAQSTDDSDILLWYDIVRIGPAK